LRNTTGLKKYLGLAGNLFFLALSLSGAVKLGLHFGFINAEWADRLDQVRGAAFMSLLVVYLGFLGRALFALIEAGFLPARNGKSATSDLS
jgi:hypothetical protein